MIPISFVVPYRWLADRAGRLEQTLRQLGELIVTPDEIIVPVMPSNELWCRAAAINKGVAAAINEWILVTSIDLDWTSFDVDDFRSRYLRGDPLITFMHPVPGMPEAEKGGDAMAFRKSSWRRLGGFDEDYKGWGWEDIDWVERCREEGLELIQADIELPHIPHPVYETAPYWVGQLGPFHEWKMSMRAERRRWLENLGLRGQPGM